MVLSRRKGRMTWRIAVTAVRMVQNVGGGENEKEKGEEDGACLLITQAAYEGHFAGMSFLESRCDVPFRLKHQA